MKIVKNVLPGTLTLTDNVNAIDIFSDTIAYYVYMDNVHIYKAETFREALEYSMETLVLLSEK